MANSELGNSDENDVSVSVLNDDIDDPTRVEFHPAEALARLSGIIPNAEAKATESSIRKTLMGKHQ